MQFGVYLNVEYACKIWLYNFQCLKIKVKNFRGKILGLTLYMVVTCNAVSLFLHGDYLSDSRTNSIQIICTAASQIVHSSLITDVVAIYSSLSTRNDIVITE